MRYNLKEGEELIQLARRSIRNYFENKKTSVPEEKKFRQARGVFVTIRTYPEKQLRGCIGFPYPNLPIGKAVREAAISAAFQDPRFPPLTKEELNSITIEISILTTPQEVRNIKEIKTGRHGLICNYFSFSGLLLPQVAVEFNLNRVEFLEALCQKAGLPKDTWQNKSFKLYKFECQIFEEISPNGKVKEKSL